MTYLEKLRDIRWQKKKVEIQLRDEWTCQLCGDKTTSVQVHHLVYKGEPWEIDNQFLVLLCEHCHTIVSYYKKTFNAEVHQIKKRIFKPHQIAFEVYDSHKHIFYESIAFLFNKTIVYIHKDRESLEWVLPLLHQKIELFQDIAINAYETESNTELLEEILTDTCKDFNDFVEDNYHLVDTDEKYDLWEYFYIGKAANIFLHKLGYE